MTASNVHRLPVGPDPWTEQPQKQEGKPRDMMAAAIRLMDDFSSSTHDRILALEASNREIRGRLDALEKSHHRYQLWNAFMRRVSCEVGSHARDCLDDLWSTVRFRNLPAEYPRCGIVDDVVQAVWDNGDEQLEVTFMPDGHVDWFFSNRRGSVLEDGEGEYQAEKDTIICRLKSLL